MTRRKREITRQTYRLYNLLKISVLDTEKIDKNKLIAEINDCINKGADLNRRIYGSIYIIWYAIERGHDPSIIKLLMDKGGLLENKRIINCIIFTRKSDINLYYTKSLEWIISETFEGLEEYKQMVLTRIKEEGEEEEEEDKEEEEGRLKCIKELDLTMKRYEEYKQVFDIEKFDLNFCRKNGYYE
jgi:hypothetical protein